MTTTNVPACMDTAKNGRPADLSFLGAIPTGTRFGFVGAVSRLTIGVFAAGALVTGGSGLAVTAMGEPAQSAPVHLAAQSSPLGVSGWKLPCWHNKQVGCHVSPRYQDCHFGRPDPDCLFEHPYPDFPNSCHGDIGSGVLDGGIDGTELGPIGQAGGGIGDKIGCVVGYL